MITNLQLHIEHELHVMDTVCGQNNPELPGSVLKE